MKLITRFLSPLSDHYGLSKTEFTKHKRFILTTGRLKCAHQLASIDGVTGVDPSFAKCTTLTSSTGLIYRKEIKEGDGASADGGTAVGVASASMATTDGFSRYNGCFIDTADGQVGIALGLEDAQLCAAEVADHCAALGNP